MPCPAWKQPGPREQKLSLNWPGVCNPVSVFYRDLKCPPSAASTTIITMLPATAHVAGVLQGPDGVFANGSKGALIIDCSTIDPVASRDLNNDAAKQGFRMIDAPVSFQAFVALVFRMQHC